MNKWLLLPAIGIIAAFGIYKLANPCCHSKADKQADFMPAPTELVTGYQAESEDWKEKRQQWFEETHGSGNYDWRAIEEANQLKKQKAYNIWIKENLAMGILVGQRSQIITADGNLVGSWYERGSYNQAGRMHTVDIDWSNLNVYGASSGKNVWKGNMDGREWQSLNDLIPNETVFIRYANAAEGIGCSPSWKVYNQCINAGGTFDLATSKCSGCNEIPDASTAQGPCPPGRIMDCRGNCRNASEFTSWVGDGTCDNGASGNYYCDEYDNDGGDCGATPNGCSEDWLAYLDCINNGGTYDVATGTCTGATYSCPAFTDAAAAQGPCPAGQFMDCDGECWDNSYWSRLGDGQCTDGSDGGPNLMCNEFNDDNGDCNSRMRIITAGNKMSYYSNDEGTTWNKAKGLEHIENWGTIQRGIVTNTADPIIYILTLEWDYVNWGPVSSIYRSDNMGQTYYHVIKFRGYADSKDIWTDRYGSGSVYCMSADSLFEINTTTNALSYISSTGGSSTRTVLTGAEISGNTYLYAYQSGDIYRSTNGGLSWTYQSSQPEGIFRRSMTASTTDPTVLYFGGVNCYRSIDAGATWNQINFWGAYYGDPQNKLHADIMGIDAFIDPLGNEVVMINTDGGTYKSYDKMANVENISMKGLGVGQYYSVYTYKTDPNVIYIGSQDQGFQETLVDSGGVLGFDQTISGDYGQITSANDGESIWTVYPGFAMNYADAPTSNAAGFWDFIGDGWRWMSPLMEDYTDPNKIYIGGGDSMPGQYIYHLTHVPGSGITGVQLPYDFSIGGTNVITALGVSKVNPDFRYVATNNGRFFYSSDGGSNWTLSSFNEPDMYINDIEVSDNSLGTLFIGGSGYDNPGVFVSYDHGATFTALADSLPETSVNQLALDEDDDFMYAACVSGPYVYSFSSDRWYDLGGNQAPIQDWRTVDYVPATGTARFASYGRGVWDFSLECQAPTNPIAIDLTTDDALLVWDAVPGAASYTIRYREVGTGTWTTTTATTAMLPLSGLTPNTEYEYQVSDDACGIYSDLSVFKTQEETIGINEPDEWNFNLYPNPATTQVQIELSQLLNNATIKVVTIQGAVVLQEHISGSKTRLNVSKLAAGTYWITVDQDGQLSTKKFIKLE